MKYATGKQLGYIGPQALIVYLYIIKQNYTITVVVNQDRAYPYYRTCNVRCICTADQCRIKHQNEKVLGKKVIFHCFPTFILQNITTVQQPKIVFMETPIYFQIWDLIALIVQIYVNVFSINV